MYIYIYYLLPWPLSVLGDIATQELYIKSQELYIKSQELYIKSQELFIYIYILANDGDISCKLYIIYPRVI